MVAAQVDWKTALQFPASFQMVFARKLLENYDFFSRVPDQSIIRTPQNDNVDKAVAVRGKNYAFVYFPNGNELEISLEKIDTGKLQLKWLNPMDGEIIPFKKVKPENREKTNDWVLIMEKIK